ncbi:FKBP-type peptidyl-prolyl cis-trans isomerase [archaeon]|nr:MAG: FKBP-type peptidyl-prolyl cis-trans isomerase [archaeon]
MVLIPIPAVAKRNISFKSLGVGTIITYVLGKAAVAEAADDKKFETTQSGLQYRDLKVGDGASPVPGDTVRVHYTGWLDGFDSPKKFDSSYDRRSPLVFKVGTRQVIAGWDEGLLSDMKVGGKRDLIIPANLGYGNSGAGGVIPPNATLYFRVELVGIGVC